MSNAEILSPAIHEAGHFVFAASQQQTPDRLEMAFDEARSCWLGQTKLPSLGRLAVESQFVISFGYNCAGCFAQVKHAIEALDADAIVPWNRLCNWVESNPSGPLSLAITGGKTLVVPLAWFDQRDRESFQHDAGVAKFGLPDFESYGNYVGQAFREVIEVMEDVGSWEKVGRLAVKLASSIHQRRARVDASDVSPW